MEAISAQDSEKIRLREARENQADWKKWGTYLSERQWGTVREDYSENGDAWNYFTHDRDFLRRAFDKLVLNFTWWVNRKDAAGKNVFDGGFLGLDNIGVFDRSAPLPTGENLEQADGTAWEETMP